MSSSFHPYTGGVEEHVRHVAKELDRAGVPVEIWTVDRGEHLGTRVVDELPVRYLPTPLPARDARALGRFALAAPAALRQWWRAYREFRPDVLHVHCFGPNGVYALVLHRVTGTPLVVSSHGETFADDHGVFDRSALLRLALRRSIAAAAVTAPSQFVLDDLSSRFGHSGGTVVPNGVDLDEPVAAAPAAAAGPTVFAVGRVERNKGFDLLLDAAARLDGIRVVIGGDGDELGSLRQYANRLGLAEQVHFPGRLDRPEVGAWMERADAVVVPSRREAFGIVVLEAWRAGTPVVATNHGGVREFVTHGVDGVLVDPEDTEALADALRAVLYDPEGGASLAEAGNERVRDFTWGYVTRAYMDVYRRVTR